MRILVTSSPGAGHIHPLVPLAAALQSAQHEVLWATEAAACARVERYGFRSAPAGISVQERRRVLLEHAPNVLAIPERERRHVFLPVMFGRIAAPPMRADLVAIVDRFRPDVVIHEVGEFAAAPVAAARDIPHVTVGFGLALPPSLLAATAAEVADVWKAEGLEPSDSAGLYDHLYFHPLPPGLGETITASTATAMRPLHFDGAANDEPDWIAGFGRDRPAIYVTFGTEIAGLAPWTEMIEALGAIDADAVATFGSTIAQAPDRVPPNVRVEEYVPQTFLLDRATAVASHAGSGTLFAAAARGLPQLCLPIGADQWDNADALDATGAGRTLELEERDAATIHDALTQLLESSSTRDAANTLAGDFAALPHPRERVSLIEARARNS